MRIHLYKSTFPSMTHSLDISKTCVSLTMLEFLVVCMEAVQSSLREDAGTAPPLAPIFISSRIKRTWKQMGKSMVYAYLRKNSFQFFKRISISFWKYLYLGGIYSHSLLSKKVFVPRFENFFFVCINKTMFWGNKSTPI